MWLFHYFNFERNYDVLKWKSLCFTLNKYINFNKNEMESRMENPIHTFREMNIVLQLIQELQIKSKTLMSWSSQKKKECIFVTFILSEGTCVLCFISIYIKSMFYLVCVLSQHVCLDVIIMSRTSLSVNLHSIVTWMSRNALLKTGAISEV